MEFPLFLSIGVMQTACSLCAGCPVCLGTPTPDFEFFIASLLFDA